MKKKNNWFMRLLAISFIAFIGLYIASVSGYYESKVGDKVALTDEAMRQFEQDILEGKEVDIKSYVTDESKDYSNVFTETGEKVATVVEKVFTEGFGGLWDAIKILFF